MIGLVSLRRATPEDQDALLRWRNDPVTCANFHNRAPFSAGTMRRWLLAALGDPRVGLHVAERDGLPVGVLRVDPDGAVMMIVAPEARGQGVAGAMLGKLPDRPLFAEIRATNVASRKAFERAGFVADGSRYGMMVYRRGERSVPAVTVAGGPRRSWLRRRSS